MTLDSTHLFQRLVIHKAGSILGNLKLMLLNLFPKLPARHQQTRAPSNECLVGSNWNSNMA